MLSTVGDAFGGRNSHRSSGGGTAGERGGKRARAPPDGAYRKYYRITRRGLVEVGNWDRELLSATYQMVTWLKCVGSSAVYNLVLSAVNIMLSAVNAIMSADNDFMDCSQYAIDCSQP